MSDGAGSDTEPAPARRERRGLELLVVVLLGVVGVATAYTSFQSNLYGNAAGDLVSRSEDAFTQGQSDFETSDAQLQRDLQTVIELQQLQAAIDAGDPYAQAEWDARYAYAVAGYPLEEALQRAAVYDGTQEGEDGNPINDEAYRAVLFAPYAESQAEADRLRAEAATTGILGDRLGLYVAVMAIVLFLLGVAAVVKRRLLKWVLIGVGSAIFLTTAVGVAVIPFRWIGM